MLRGLCRFLLVVPLLAFAACSGGAVTSQPTAEPSSTEVTSAPTAAPSAAPTSAPAQEQRVLRVWHYEPPNNAMGKAWAAAIKEFEATHPGVKVEFEQKEFEQIRQTATMVMSSDRVPDVMEYNKGNASTGLLSTEGMLTDLTAIAAQRGWDKLLSPSLQTTCRYNEQGIMGSGNWYGVTNYGEYVMVYYNKDMFAQHGLEVPTSLEEFEAVMDRFVKAGITPLALSGAEYPAQQVFYELVLSQADRTFLNAFQLYQGDVDFHGPEFTFAAERMAQWIERGYSSEESTGIKSYGMADSFMKGKSPIMISGSWWYSQFMDEIKGFEWGMFLFPGNSFHPGSGGNLWVVPSRAQNKDLAYDFIDITMKQEIQTLVGNAGGIPINADLSKITDPKAKELIRNFDTVIKSDGLAFYPDWPAPGYYDVLVANVQELIAGTKKPEQFLDGIAAPYQANVATIDR